MAAPYPARRVADVAGSAKQRRGPVPGDSAEVGARGCAPAQHKREKAIMSPDRARRFGVVRKYLSYSLLGHLAWEIGQLPLYTIFWDARAGETAFAVLHYTAGDLLIAACTLAAWGEPCVSPSLSCRGACAAAWACAAV